jgi:hypothetical protein
VLSLWVDARDGSARSGMCGDYVRENFLRVVRWPHLAIRQSYEPRTFNYNRSCELVDWFYGVDCEERCRDKVLTVSGSGVNYLKRHGIQINSILSPHKVAETCTSRAAVTKDLWEYCLHAFTLDLSHQTSARTLANVADRWKYLTTLLLRVEIGER